MLRAILKVYGILTIAYTAIVLFIVMFGGHSKSVENTLLGINVCNTVIWFVISFWACHLTKSRSDKAE